MASQDFIELMNKLHNEKYKMLSKRVEYDGMSETPSLRVIVVLEKDGNQISIQSSEPDFLKHVVELRGVSDTTGDPKFAVIKDLKRYNDDVEHLIDLDHSKAKKAAEEIISGRFRFEYNPGKMIYEFLKSERNVRNKKYLPLKTDYHHILVGCLLESKEYLKSQERLIKRYPGAKKFIDAIGEILISLRATNNRIKDYQFYKGFVDFDIDEWSKRIVTQLKIIDDTIKEFIRRGSVPGDIAIPRMMNIYGRCLELSTPVINLIRVGLDIKNGEKAPKKRYWLSRNIRILKSDPVYGGLFDCLDENIRHSDAHASIDIANGNVHILETRGHKSKIIKTYTFEQIMTMIDVMEEELFPSIVSILVIHEMAALDLVLVSKEYKFLLLALGNC